MTFEHLAVTCHVGDIVEPTEQHVFIAPFPCLIASARLVTTSPVAESEPDQWQVSLLQQRADAAVQMVGKTTAPETGQEIRPNVEWSFDVSPWNAEARRLPTGAVVTMRWESRGTPPPMTGVLIVLRYEPT